MDAKDLIAKFDRLEKDLLESTFISPVVRGGKVKVRLQGLVYEFKVKNDFEGWAVLSPTSRHCAKVVGRPSLRQISDYLQGLKRIRLTLCRKGRNVWYGIAPSYDPSMEFPFPIFLTSGCELFDGIMARFDGKSLWFEMQDRSCDPTIGEYLRQCLEESVPLEKLEKPGLTPWQRAAYRQLLVLKGKNLGELTLDRIKEQVSKAGGRFISYIERKDSYTVRFSMGGEEFSPTIRKSDFSVISAGICLEGEDQKFDLQSMVSVAKEGQGKESIYRTNG